MNFHVITNIVSKDGVLKDVHKNMMGRLCYIIILEDGFPALIKVDVHNTLGIDGFHTIQTTKVISHVGETDSDLVEIETKNTIYKLKKTSRREYSKTYGVEWPFDD